MSDEDILAHARDVFLEHGPGVSTTRVAERCGLSQASLFKRFGDKQTLLLRALQPPGQPPFVELLRGGAQPGPLRPQLIEIAHQVLAFFREMVPCVATLAASGVDPHTLLKGYDVPPPVVSMLAMTAWFESASERLREVPPNHLAIQFLGSLHVRAFMAHVAGDAVLGDDGPYIESAVDTFLHGAEA